MSASVVSLWDLQSRYSPRSVASCSEIVNLYSSNQQQTHNASATNPFDDAATPSSRLNNDTSLGIILGTEKGSLHSRLYNVPGSSALKSPGRTLALQTPINSTRNYTASSSTQTLPLDLPTAIPQGQSIIALINCGYNDYLALVDDEKGATISGAYAAYYITLNVSTSSASTTKSATVSGSSWNVIKLDMRVSAAAFHPAAGLVYAAGKTLTNKVPQKLQLHRTLDQTEVSTLLPAPGARSGPNGLVLIHNGRVAVVAVGHAFYAVSLQEGGNSSLHLLLSLQQSSQVHPVISLSINDPTLESEWACCFVASGRECAVVDVYYTDDGNNENRRLSVSKPRHGTVMLASPLLNAVVSLPWVVLLTSDGLVSVRSPSCLAIPLRTVEVGTRPNDFFSLTVINSTSAQQMAFPYILALAYSGQAKVLQCHPDSSQDLADRLMRHAIDAFGSNGFPRAQVAEAVQASFTATSYVGPEASATSKSLLQHYLEAILGLTDWESGSVATWPTEYRPQGQTKSGIAWGQRSPETTSVVSTDTPAALLTATALLCLVCSQVTPINATLAKRAAKKCANGLGVMITTEHTAATEVCTTVAEKILKETSSGISLLSGSSPAPISRRNTAQNVQNDTYEAVVWLLRACGQHQQALVVVSDRLYSRWSTIKYESYVATHLSELWAANGHDTVLKSPELLKLLESNPSLGLSVLTSLHPQNDKQWHEERFDPLLVNAETSTYILKLLKSVQPALPDDANANEESEYSKNEQQSHRNIVTTTTDKNQLPLDSGRALTVTFLESAFGIYTGRSLKDVSEKSSIEGSTEASIANFHDEYAYLLLEGIISERRDDAKDDLDSDIGLIYRQKLRQYLRWPMAKLRSNLFMESLPSGFLQEKALVYGRLGRHQDAIKILYHDLKSLELALQYCDDRHQRQKAQIEQNRGRTAEGDHAAEYDNYRHSEEDNAYLPLMQVALDSDAETGAKVAIQVLSLRRSAIDRAAALRLLPSDIPVSAVARPFLIPALVDSESQVRRLTVVSALLRARYLRLQEQLTGAQLQAQANLHVVPQLRHLNLGEPLHSTKPLRVGKSASSSAYMPELHVIEHFFPRHLVIQAQVINNKGNKSTKQAKSPDSSNNVRHLADIDFVVAESSEDALQALLQVPVKLLPPGQTGSAWCVLQATPGRMESATAALTCELRYTVQSNTAGGRTFVEELHDLEIQTAYFRT